MMWPSTQRQISRIHTFSKKQKLYELYSLSNTPLSTAVKIQNMLKKHRIDSVIGGSMALAIHAQPRYTKDIDINVDVTFEKLKYILGKERILSEKPIKFGIADRVQKEFKSERVEIVSANVDGIPTDIFLNTCRATRRVHLTSRIVDGVKVMSPECLAHFKLMLLNNPPTPRNYQDEADLVSLISFSDIKCDLVGHYAREVFGEKNWRVKKWEKLTKRFN